MDISMDRRYAELCGISDAELHKYFEEDIHALADELGTDYAHACELLKVNYDGYHFCYKSAGMYNPFSLLNTFAKRQIGSYWFETGTPTYLVELMKLHHYNVEEIEHIVTSGPVLDRGFHRPCTGHLPERLPHHQGLQRRVRELYPRIPKP